MVLLPKATKTNLVKLVRSKGYDVPSIRKAWFWGNNRSRCYSIHWKDAQLESHYAMYSAAGGRPFLMVDKDDMIYLTMAEVIHFGLVKEK